MIKELINFTENLEENTPQIFSMNKEPSKGIHFLIELDEQRKLKIKNYKENEDFGFYDGKSDLNSFLKEAIIYEDYGKRVGNTMNKVLDKKKKINSCSPFIIAFRKKFVFDDNLDGHRFEKIRLLLTYYLNNARETCLQEDDEQGKQLSIAFENEAETIFLQIEKLLNVEGKSFFEEMKDDFYVNIYLKNASEEQFKDAHETYLRKKLFNTDKFNTDIDEVIFGLSNYLNGLNSKKTFLEHKTASFFKGISGRITDQDALFLNKFEILLGQKVLPNPLPIFIDKNEFQKSSDIISIYQKDDKISYSQILKQLFKKDESTTLQNYYLLFIERGDLKDFDFVSKFEYKLENCEIQNIFQLKKKVGEQRELLPTRTIKSIFGFESYVVKNIFNNALVKAKDDSYRVNYFGDVPDAQYCGGDLMEQLIRNYRKAFYDYIYKSNKTAITSKMFDKIMTNSILGDIRLDEFKEKYHTKEINIKEKLNIWFSLYNYFELNKNHKRIDMANKTVNLLKELKEIASVEEKHIEQDEVFAFAVGQLVHYLLNKSEASSRTHSLLEPFLQKTKASELKLAIARTFENYKHAIPFYRMKFSFDKMMSDVMGYEPNEKNMKKLLPMILAGYFSETIFKKEKTNELENNINPN